MSTYFASGGTASHMCGNQGAFKISFSTVNINSSIFTEWKQAMLTSLKEGAGGLGSISSMLYFHRNRFHCTSH